MKKFLMFLILAIGFFSANAQTILKVDNYVYLYTGVAADTVSTVDTLWTKDIQLNKLEGLFYNGKVKVSDITAGAKCKVSIKGKIFATDAYTNITTVQWYGGGTDTTILFTSNTNKVYWRYLQFEVDQVATKLKVDYINLSLKK